MKYLKPFTLIIAVFFFLSCNSDDNNSVLNDEPSAIEIGNYRFQFETKFTLEELQGIDSYVGNVNGSGITISFDYGWYTRPVSNLPTDEYIVTEDEINGHYRQIVEPIDSESNYTRIHLFKISDSIESPDGYNSLTLYTNNLNTVEQNMIIEVFNNVTIVE
ncbi:hypothetical protein [Sediminibacter sp. Hel_I_10]|uniref:hypothetical protein n=1 Tax=Sediminibacter sp. Hel_I_10 TaxID=1392490 RepID=UPI00047C11E8|nr:hypothetical protein [Sediminibacter sp. Hel_I_10]